MTEGVQRLTVLSYLAWYSVSDREPRELEFKLAIDATDVVAVRSHLTSRFGPPLKTEHLASVYYDTGKQELRSNGMSVRIRSVGDRKWQTVKAPKGAAAGLFDRSEWETEIDGDKLDLEALAKTPVQALLPKGRTSLKPAFETVVDRTLWLVETERSAIEIALDEGKVA